MRSVTKPSTGAHQSLQRTSRSIQSRAGHLERRDGSLQEKISIPSVRGDRADASAVEGCGVGAVVGLGLEFQAGDREVRPQEQRAIRVPAQERLESRFLPRAEDFETLDGRRHAIR